MPSDHLVIERTFSVPPDRLWHALTRDEELAAWFWPSRFHTTATVELRPGGSWRIASEPMGMGVGGVYRDVEPYSLLTFTWRWDSDSRDSLVEITTASTLAGTNLTLTHTGFDSEAERDNHLDGWNSCLDRLPERLRDDRDQ